MMRRWTIDECRSADGHWTIREVDGSPNGNIEMPVIATVYWDFRIAAEIVKAVNTERRRKERKAIKKGNANAKSV